ncbi:hypothetical protein GCM10009665_20940 [Kitasatospora nipponensis]|uniref:Peptidase inhibitor family I36 n=1 Tax=Kitasatospora nipponensis TaxID=258049 RepID=A0ABN1W2X5_9ACTN
MVALRNKIAALALSAGVLAGGVAMASPASASTTSCSAARGVEVWEYSNYGGGCVMFTSSTADTRSIRYPSGNNVYAFAGTAENNYPWTVKLCYEISGNGGCQYYGPGPYSANLNFQGAGSVYI